MPLFLRGRFAFFSMAVLAAMFASAEVNAQTSAEHRLQSFCKVQSPHSSPAASCEFRPIPAIAVDGAAVTIKESGASVPTHFSAFDPLVHSSAWMFLVDRSDPSRRGAVARIGEDILRIAATAEGRTEFGLASFAADIDVLAPPGASEDLLKEKVAGLTADGHATEMYRSALEAIRILGEANADRRVLFLMSDGKAEDTVYNISDVVTAAKEAGVIIVALGYPERPSAAPHLQSLRRLAEASLGEFAAANPQTGHLSDDFVRSIGPALQSGGVVWFDAARLSGNVAVEIKAHLSGGQSAIAQETIQFPDRAPAVAAEPEEMPAPTPTRANNRLLMLLAGGGLLLLFSMLFVFARRRKVPEPEAREGERVAGYLRFLDNEMSQVPLQGTNIRIGRHRDNDIRIMNNTVSARHALLHFDRAKEKFVITDLNSTNGVSVNKVRSKQHELSDGDLIELGEVRAKFLLE